MLKKITEINGKFINSLSNLLNNDTGFYNFSTKSENSYHNNNRKINVVTTPIFYVNSSPHIGHLYSVIFADAVKQWLDIKNISSTKIIFSTGTDEHGIKILKKVFSLIIYVRQKN